MKTPSAFLVPGIQQESPSIPIPSTQQYPLIVSASCPGDILFALQYSQTSRDGSFMNSKATLAKSRLVQSTANPAMDGNKVAQKRPPPFQKVEPNLGPPEIRQLHSRSGLVLRQPDLGQVVLRPEHFVRLEMDHPLPEIQPSS
ncbi:hypothetical protein MKZ38_002366 [Zalerion maritima]|uniref:Uncharacterized protein n=1 Tax=Zalerion maritima TaxID=339359 RepID=A0AAD5S586_9PEZI|nr:hypothetical protein MKZ38_002366 [Zalerion maritima]